MPRPPRPRSARRQFCATILGLEVFVVLFAALVVFGLDLVGPRSLALGGGALALSLAVAAGLQGRPGGIVVGSALQVPLLAAGIWLSMPMLVVVAVLFAALWVTAVRLGGRIDRERAARAAAG
ncbi:DUF4233 domain-containing protein [Isoptericola sp. b441]|uniref:DUF4233 domain-containing protein n=1 Tax=Actinotalea lenta TaxID=3064654 RepID=A0ABT9D8U2_9CELL|nr:MULTISPECIES: DUF4233 domain-containing protein [unclassified Isoptericola]MDO8107315.1 DUF4233 domain-containing protein [Isoptericola sp. b441]MDO8121023.1 DUF4233 domain-containing protein [Isoptericola sp. b490]